MVLTRCAVLHTALLVAGDLHTRSNEVGRPAGGASPLCMSSRLAGRHVVDDLVGPIVAEVAIMTMLRRSAPPAVNASRQGTQVTVS